MKGKTYFHGKSPDVHRASISRIAVCVPCDLDIVFLPLYLIGPAILLPHVGRVSFPVFIQLILKFSDLFVLFVDNLLQILVSTLEFINNFLISCGVCSKINHTENIICCSFGSQQRF